MQHIKTTCQREIAVSAPKKQPRRAPAAASKTMEDIARLAQVSKPTVSRALQDSPLVNAETKRRVVAIARKYGYSVNRNAQKLRGKRTNTIAVVLDFPSHPGKRVSDPFIFELLADVAKALAIRHQDLLLCSPDVDEAHAYQAMLASKGADGIIFLGQGGRDPWLKDLARTNAPFVVWGAVDDDRAYCAVGSDNRRGGVLAGQRFAQLKRKRVVFLGSRAHRELEQRREGLAEGLGPGATIVDLEVPDFSYESSYAAFKEMLARGARKPDAVFAASDTAAMAVIAALRDHGLGVPDDVSVIGYNDIPYAAHFSPGLTTIRQDTNQAGSLLVEKLFQLLDGARPTSVKLPTDLVLRAT